MEASLIDVAVEAKGGHEVRRGTSIFDLGFGSRFGREIKKR